MVDKKKFASLLNLKLFKENADNTYATKEELQNLADEVAYLNSEDNDTVTDVEISGDAVGGGANIDVIAEVGQTIVVRKVDANGKPTAWEAVDYQERTHWKTEKLVSVLESTTPEYNEDMGGFMLMNPVDVKAGNTYIVNWNGTEYRCVAGEVPVEGATTTVLGDMYTASEGQMGTAPTGEPFVIQFIPAGLIEMAGFGAMILPIDGSESITLSISHDESEYHTIPKEYIDLDSWMPEERKVLLVPVTECAAERRTSIGEEGDAFNQYFQERGSNSKFTIHSSTSVDSDGNLIDPLIEDITLFGSGGNYLDFGLQGFFAKNTAGLLMESGGSVSNMGTDTLYIEVYGYYYNILPGGAIDNTKYLPNNLRTTSDYEVSKGQILSVGACYNKQSGMYYDTVITEIHTREVCDYDNPDDISPNALTHWSIPNVDTVYNIYTNLNQKISALEQRIAELEGNAT